MEDLASHEWDFSEGDESPRPAAETAALAVRPTARSVMVGTTLEDLAVLSRCNGRGRRIESCRERRESRRLLLARPDCGCRFS